MSLFNADPHSNAFRSAWVTLKHLVLDVLDVRDQVTSEISEMPLHELLNMLAEWTPQSPLDEDPEGLAQQLTVAVGEAPGRYAPEAAEFASLHPVYVRGLLRGFSRALEHGRVFVWYAAGPDWVREHLPAMFPTAPNSQHLYDVAWSVYLIAWKPGLPLFQLLQEQYRKAVDEIDEATEARDREVRADPTSVVVRQITKLYVWGLEDEAGLSGSFDRLLERGSDSVRGVAIRQIGETLSAEDLEVPPELLGKLVRLWDERLSWHEKRDLPAAKRTELGAFGWWFTSGRFGDEWSIGQLDRAVPLTTKLENEHGVVSRLTSLSRLAPRTALRCSLEMVRKHRGAYDVHLWLDDLRLAVQHAVAADAEAVLLARELIDELKAQGFNQLDDLRQ